jgi:PAS domain S-box-containing protein
MSKDLDLQAQSNELSELRRELEEANDTLTAIRTGMVDAFVVHGEEGHQLYTLKSTDHTFRILVEKMQEGAITLNKDGLILYCNPCFADLTKVSIDKIIGKPFDYFIKGYTPDRLASMTINGKLNDYKMEDILLALDGTQIPVLLSFTNLDLEDGTALSIICTDLTTQKAAQQKEADINAQKKVIKQKDEFMSIASHELKTPLTSLKAYLQLMSRDNNYDLPLTFKNFMGKAELALNRLHTLVDDLLDASKIQAGKLNFHRTIVDINKLIENCTENASHIFQNYEIGCSYTNNLQVLGNLERLEQVVMNLINNAVKYSPVNKKISVSAKSEGKFIRISVLDHGIGMNEDQQEKIFDRFYRVNNNNHTVGGLGMGLYISKEIVKEHNGIIQVQSNLNQGSTFHIILPAVNTTADELL